MARLRNENEEELKVQILQNAKTLFLADKPEYLRLGLRYARLRFTTETPAQCEAVMARYCGEGEYTPADLTRGLFYRGVE